MVINKQKLLLTASFTILCSLPLFVLYVTYNYFSFKLYNVINKVIEHLPILSLHYQVSKYNVIIFCIRYFFFFIYTYNSECSYDAIFILCT